MNRPGALNLAPPTEEGYLQPELSQKRHQQQKYQADSGFADLGSNGSSLSGAGSHDNGAFAMSPVLEQQRTTALSLSAADVSRPRMGRAAAAHDSYHVDGGPLALSNDELHAEQQTSEFCQTPVGYQNSWSRTVEGGRQPQAASSALGRAGESGGSRVALVPAGGPGLKLSRENMALPPRPESISGGHEYEELPGGGYLPARQNKYLARAEADRRGNGSPRPDQSAAGLRPPPPMAGGGSHPPHMARGLSSESGRKKSNPLYSLRLSEQSLGRSDSDEAASVTELSREQHGNADELPAKGSQGGRSWRRRWSLLLWLLVVVAVVAVGAAIVAALVAASAIGGSSSGGTSAAAAAAVKGASTALPVLVNQSFEQQLASLQEQVVQLKNLTALQAQMLELYRNQMSALDARLQSDAVALRGNYSALSLTVSRLDSSVVQFASNLNNSVDSLSSLVANVSKMPGPPGPPGFNGSQGAQGTANFSACEFAVDSGPSPTSWSPDPSTKPSYYYNMTAVSATCSVTSTSGSVTSWKLNRRRDASGKTQYSCDCTGTSGSSTTCAVYVWFCPNQR